MSLDPYQMAAALNEKCNCFGADIAELHNRIEHRLREALPGTALLSSHPHLFSPIPVFLADTHAEQMRTLIEAIEHVFNLPAYQEHVLASAPAMARSKRAAKGVFLGYDFHITDAGPRLIEVNTNAGGALLNLELLGVQLECCDESRELSGHDNPTTVAAALVEMFRHEWQLERGNAPLRYVAIVDTTPVLQYLYPEFLLFKKLFEAHGIEAAILDPSQLRLEGGRLTAEAKVIDLVYNRLTDFYFAEPDHAALRAAYDTQAAVFTPTPHAHALYADKRNLVILSDAQALGALGVESRLITTLMQGIPRTELVRAADAARWWSERKRWFFKPTTGYGSRGVYRGDKLTRSVFQSIMQGGYIAQELVSPSERRHQGSGPGSLRVDVRNYVYEGAVQLIAARLYRGQTTNFRTPGGGFAPVFFVSQRRIERIKPATGHGCCT